MIDILMIGIMCTVVGFIGGMLCHKIVWGNRGTYDGTLLINHDLNQVQFNIKRDISELSTDDHLTIEVKVVNGDNDIIVREET